MTIVAEFEDRFQQDSVSRLTMLIRGLRVGEGIRMPDGAVVKSIARPHQGDNRRRFCIVPPEDKSTPEERHRAVVLGHSQYDKAEDAAKAALDR